MTKEWLITHFSITGSCAQVLLVQEILFSVSGMRHGTVYNMSQKYHTVSETNSHVFQTSTALQQQTKTEKKDEIFAKSFEMETEVLGMQRGSMVQDNRISKQYGPIQHLKGRSKYHAFFGI